VNLLTKNHSYVSTAQWTAVVHRSNSICAAFTESRMAARHKGVVVADIGSDVERLGVPAEARADRTEELQFTIRSSVVSFNARLDADIVLDIAFLFQAAYADSVSESCGVRHTIGVSAKTSKRHTCSAPLSLLLMRGSVYTVLSGDRFTKNSSCYLNFIISTGTVDR